MRLAEILYKTDVALHVGQHLLPPLLSLSESGDCSYGGEDVRLVQLVGLQPPVKLFTNIGIGHQGMTGDNTRDVEGLGGSLEGDADLRCLVRYAGKGYMVVAEDGHVAMDFVADDKEMMVVAEIGQSRQRLFRPADACRIVGVAKHEQTAFVVANLGEVVKIHLVMSRLRLLQWIPDHLALVGTRCEEEWMVDGGHDDNLLVGFHK